jgi:hypothetical protein
MDRSLAVYSWKGHFSMERHILEAEMVEMYAKKSERAAWNSTMLGQK